MRYTLHVMALAVLIPAGASAQTPATKAPVPYNQVLSTNPFILIVKWVNGEYERRVSPAVTLGASASRFDFSDAGFAATCVLTRWYPQGAALDGFYLGARVGAFRFRTSQYDYSYTTGRASSPSQITTVPPTVTERTRVVPGAGLEIGYNWLLGSKQNVSVGMGLGVTRTLGGGTRDDHSEVLPTLRLVNIGVAF